MSESTCPLRLTTGKGPIDQADTFACATLGGVERGVALLDQCARLKWSSRSLDNFEGLYRCSRLHDMLEAGPSDMDINVFAGRRALRTIVMEEGSIVHSRSLLAGLLVSMGIFLSGCDKADNSQGVASPAHEVQEKSSRQAEIEKYNIYVEAANRGGDFGDTLQKRQGEYAKPLASGKKLTSYYMFSGYDITILQGHLNKALALSYPMPELDEPAKGMLIALEKLAPVHAELANYASAKGYLADDGKKARDMEPALEAALEDVAVVQAKFYDGIRQRDEINTQTAFEDAEKDSLGYYTAGIVLYAKQSVRLSDDFFRSAGTEETARPFEESLNKTAKMIEGWDKTGRAQTPALKCNVLLSDLNGFVGKGRQAISTARSGGYKFDEQRQMMWELNNPIKRDAKTFGQSFASLINGLNQDRCI